MPQAERASFTEDRKISDDHAQLLEWMKQAEEATGQTKWAETSQEDYKFYAGDQDTDGVKELLEEQNRPVSVYNEVKPKIDMLIGMAAQSRFEPSVLPVGVEDEPLAELMGSTLKHYTNKTKKVDKEIECFEHTVKSGRSLLYFYIDKQNPFKPKIMCKRMPGHMFMLDPDSVEYDMSDAKFLFIDKWVTEKEMKLFFPDIEPEIIKDTHESSDRPAFWNEAKEKYRIVEAWYRKWEWVEWFVNPITGAQEYLERDDFNKFRKLLAEGIENPETGEVKTYEITGSIPTLMERVYYMIFTDQYELESGLSPYRWEGFPAVLFGAYKDEDNNAWFGAIKAMKDPQRAINTMRRQLSHLLQTLPKGMLVHEVGAILNIEEYEEKSADPAFHLELAKGAIDKYTLEKQPQISPIYQIFDGMMSQGMKDSSGIQDDLMGFQKTSREPGITVRMRQEAGIAVLYLLFNNFRMSRLISSRILLSMVQQYVTLPEIIRVQGEQGMQLIQINTQMNPQSEGFNDISAGEYDVELDEAVENSTMRMTIAQILTDFAQNNPGTIPPHIVLDYVNLPFTTKMAVRDFWQQQMELEQENRDADRALKMAEIGSKAQIEREKIEASKKKEKEAKDGNK